MNRVRLTPACVLTLLLSGIVVPVAQAQSGRGAATTVQLPTFGVSIDAAGVVQMQTLVDPTGALRAQRLQATQQRLPRDVQARSPLRKVSLARLERALATRRTAGQSAAEEMLYLAGLQQLRYAFVYPEEHDIVLVGEAEGWIDDGLGRMVGMSTGRPALRLDDLAAALSVFAQPDPTATFVGCTIDPTPEGLSRLEQLKADLPRSISDAARQSFATELDRRTRESLGRAVVRVFGIAPATHAAAVLVEADYRMKRMAVGVEPNPVGIPSYVDRATGAGNGLIRYWFVPDYQRLQTDPAFASLEVLGRGVRLQTEQLLVAADGTIETAPQAAAVRIDPAAKAFCDDFTKRYDEIAARSPVYAELRNVVDLLVTAAFLRRHDWFARAAWQPTLLVDPERIAAGRPTPTAADVVVNPVWKGRKLISAAGGGVSIVGGDALRSENLRTVDAAQFAEHRAAATKLPADGRWWWD